MKTPNHITLLIVQLLSLSLGFAVTAQPRPRRPPQGGRLAVVVDERLSALRLTPDLSGQLVQRLSRGRLVALQNRKVVGDGIVFYRVRVTNRTQGWIQKEAVIQVGVAGADQVLLNMVRSSQDFDRLVRARIFLDTFSHSVLRPQVLLLYAEAAESAAAKLSREAVRRLNLETNATNTAPAFSYFLNYVGLDRYNRQGVRFLFDRTTGQFHYNGWAWREIIFHYPHSSEAIEARKRMASLKTVQVS